MGSFKRALLGYRRADVDAAIAGRDARIGEMERQLAAAAELEAELSTLSGMVVEREREIRLLNDQLRETSARHERSIAALEAISGRLEEIQAQARGQATRIRMKALSEAVEVSRRVQELTGALDEQPAAAGAKANGHASIEPRELFDGVVRVEIGPLEDFGQLVRFEDAAGKIAAASAISVERFSEGRATLSLRLEEPVDLVDELERLSPLGFRVRRRAGDCVVLDVDAAETTTEQQAA